MVKSMLNTKPEKAGKKRGEPDKKDKTRTDAPAAKSVKKVTAEGKDQTEKSKPASGKAKTEGTKLGHSVEAKGRKQPVIQRMSKRDKKYSEELKEIEIAGDEIAIDQKLVTELGDLPELYGHSGVVLMPVDAHLANVYCEIDDADLERVHKKLKRKFGHLSPVLRFFDITDLVFDGTTARGFFDMDINLNTRNWYVSLPGLGKSYFADLGMKTAGGIFFPILRSNAAQTPRESPDPAAAEECIFVSRDEASLTAVHASGGQRQVFDAASKSSSKRAKTRLSGNTASPATGLSRKPLVYPKPVMIESVSSGLSGVDDLTESDFTDISERGFVQGISSGSFSSH